MTAAAAPVVVDAAAMPVGLREAVFIEAVTEEEDAAALAVPLVPSPATTVTAAAADPADDEEDAAALTAAAAPAPLEEALVEALLAPAVPLLPLPPA